VTTEGGAGVTWYDEIDAQLEDDGLLSDGNKGSIAHEAGYVQDDHEALEAARAEEVDR